MGDEQETVWPLAAQALSEKINQLEAKLSSLEQQVNQLEQGLDSRIDSRVDFGFSTLTFAGQGCQINGGGRTWTIIVAVPTGGTVTGTLNCDTLALTGTISLSS